MRNNLLLFCSYVAAQYAGLPLYGQASQVCPVCFDVALLFVV